MTVGDNAITFAGMVEDGIIAGSAVTQIMTEAFNESLVGKLTKSIPMPITGTKMAFTTGEPVAGIVGEGELKPIVSSGIGIKTATPIKAAAIMYLTKEAEQGDRLRYTQILKQQLKDACKRAIDLAVFHGKDGVTGDTIANVEYVAQTSNTVTLPSGTDPVEFRDTISAGYDLATDFGNGFDAFAAAPTMRTRISAAQQKTDENISFNDSAGTFGGLPVYYSKTVPGNYGVVPDSNIRVIGGEFKDNIGFGYVENITLQRSTEATIVDGDKTISLWQNNLIAYLAEVQFGWIIGDVNKFVKYSNA